MNEEKEEALPRGQTLVSYIEWEDFGHSWKIDKLEPSESLPHGAAKAEVWRNESYQLKAKIAGTIEAWYVDIHPKVETGALIPVFEINGSDEWGATDYEIGSCVVGNVLSTEWKNRDTDPPIVGYEADLFSLGARWTSRHGDPTELEWLSGWYLNGPHRPRMYPQGSVTKLVETYERERKLPGNEEGNFEEIKQLGGPRFAFVETDGLSFLVQHTPKNLGPSWAECLSIEYRPTARFTVVDPQGGIQHARRSPGRLGH
jgi:hypothetical protein